MASIVSHWRCSLMQALKPLSPVLRRRVLPLCIFPFCLFRAMMLYVPTPSPPVYSARRETCQRRAAAPHHPHHPALRPAVNHITPEKRIFLKPSPSWFAVATLVTHTVLLSSSLEIPDHPYDRERAGRCVTASDFYIPTAWINRSTAPAAASRNGVGRPKSKDGPFLVQSRFHGRQQPIPTPAFCSPAQTRVDRTMLRHFVAH